MAQLIFRKGLDLKDAVAGELAAAYDSQVVDAVRAHDFTHTSGRLTIHLAREFGFCYGVDRAVDYAYQTRKRFPERRVFLTGEIIHNPHVNDRLRGQGIRFLSDAGERWSVTHVKGRRLAAAAALFLRDALRLDAAAAPANNAPASSGVGEAIERRD